MLLSDTLVCYTPICAGKKYDETESTAAGTDRESQWNEIKKTFINGEQKHKQNTTNPQTNNNGGRKAVKCAYGKMEKND